MGGVNPLVECQLAATFKVLPGLPGRMLTLMTASLDRPPSVPRTPWIGISRLCSGLVCLRPLPPVPDPPPLILVAPEGQLQVHTAPYRGSFSSVLSQAMRAAGLGSRVLISQFLKGGVQQGPAGRVQLCGGLVWLRPEVPLCLSSPGHPGGAEAVAAVWSICRQHLLQGDLDQLVLG